MLRLKCSFLSDKLEEKRFVVFLENILSQYVNLNYIIYKVRIDLGLCVSESGEKIEEMCVLESSQVAIVNSAVMQDGLELCVSYIICKDDKLSSEMFVILRKSKYMCVKSVGNLLVKSLSMYKKREYVKIESRCILKETIQGLRGVSLQGSMLINSSYMGMRNNDVYGDIKDVNIHVNVWSRWRLFSGICVSREGEALLNVMEEVYKVIDVLNSKGYLYKKDKIGRVKLKLSFSELVERWKKGRGIKEFSKLLESNMLSKLERGLLLVYKYYLKSNYSDAKEKVQRRVLRFNRSCYLMDVDKFGVYNGFCKNVSIKNYSYGKLEEELCVRLREMLLSSMDYKRLLEVLGSYFYLEKKGRKNIWLVGGGNFQILLEILKVYYGEENVKEGFGSLMCFKDWEGKKNKVFVYYRLKESDIEELLCKIEENPEVGVIVHSLFKESSDKRFNKVFEKFKLTSVWHYDKWCDEDAVLRLIVKLNKVYLRKKYVIRGECFRVKR